MTFRGLHVDDQLSTSSHDLLGDFFLPVMSAADSYDRATGYFSAALWALAPAAFADFFARGGRVRLLCSPRLAKDEKRAVVDSESNQGLSLEVAVKALEALADSKEDRRRDLLRVLSALLSVGAVELRFAEVPRDSNLFHDKVGIFRDEAGDEISFVGSANESASAWSGFGNHEQLEVFKSWQEARDRSRIDGHKQYFEELWSGKRRGVDVTSSDQAAEIVFKVVPPEPVDEILREFRAKVRREKSAEINAPEIQLRPYQESALANWRANDHKGVISFATGGGKTLTALKAIDDWTRERGPAVVLLPSTILVRQWEQEIYSWLPDVVVQIAGAGTPKAIWRKLLYQLTTEGTRRQRVTLATYQTAKTEQFLASVSGGAHLLLVGDEVHTFGATDTRVIAQFLKVGAALGLSATPERVGDDEGTEAIFDYFGPILEPRYRIEDALAAGVLCPYDYFFEVCALNEDEMSAWNSLTVELSREIAKNKGKMNERSKRIAIKRSRISKAAASKAFSAAKIVKDNFIPGDRWLIYCESINHLNSVREALQQPHPSAAIMEYHSKNKREHKEILRFFAKKGGIILAIKCLDEGVDIPATNKAVILSSSTNYREYVQRRGRVLRTIEGKSFAQIWDLLTVDTEGRPLTRGEIVRASEFAKSATNLSAQYRLESLAREAKHREVGDVENE